MFRMFPMSAPLRTTRIPWRVRLRPRPIQGPIHDCPRFRHSQSPAYATLPCLRLQTAARASLLGCATPRAAPLQSPRRKRTRRQATLRAPRIAHSLGEERAPVVSGHDSPATTSRRDISSWICDSRWHRDDAAPPATWRGSQSMCNWAPRRVCSRTCPQAILTRASGMWTRNSWRMRRPRSRLDGLRPQNPPARVGVGVHAMSVQADFVAQAFTREGL